MARSEFSPVALRAFERVFRPWMARRLRVRLAGVPASLPAQLPVLLAANHVSWWDGFLALEVRRALRPRAPIFTLMSRRELRRFPWFRRLGAVGIEPGRRAGALAAFRLLRERRCGQPDLIVSMFPQGRIWPSHRRPLGFHPGVERLAELLHPAVVLPVAIHLEPLNARTPTAFVAAGPPIATESRPDRRTIELAVESVLDRILALLSMHGEEAPAAWPGVHDPIGLPERAESVP